MREEVFIIIKPDAISRELVDDIVRRFQQIGHIEWVTGRFKNKIWCQQHYVHIFNDLSLSDIYTTLENFMVGKLLIGFILWGDNCIKRAREMAGATKNAVPGTIRADFGLKICPTCYNLVHVSDSPEAVQREIQLFLDRSTDYDFAIMSH